MDSGDSTARRSNPTTWIFAFLVAGAVAHGFLRSNQYGWLTEEVRISGRGYYQRFSHGYPVPEPGFGDGAIWRDEVYPRFNGDKTDEWSVPTLAFNWTYGLCSVVSAFALARRMALRVFLDGARFRVSHLLSFTVFCAIAFWAMRRVPAFAIIAGMTLPDLVGGLSIVWYLAVGFMSVRRGGKRNIARARLK